MAAQRYRGISEAVTAMKNGELSSGELVRHCLEKHQQYNEVLNATLCLAQDASEQAAQCDAEAKQGRFRGRLHGIPLIVKDNINVKGLPTTVASALFAQSSPCERDARVIAKLREEGAIILAKANMD